MRAILDCLQGFLIYGTFLPVMHNLLRKLRFTTQIWLIQILHHVVFGIGSYQNRTKHSSKTADIAYYRAKTRKFLRKIRAEYDIFCRPTNICFSNL